MTGRRWDDDALLLMWHIGRTYGLAAAHEALDEAVHAGMAPPHRSAAQRYADRLAELEVCAARTGRPPYAGGPVAWDTP